MNLIIVESPTKAKTISGFLGKNFVIESSFGHIRDLPKNKLGIDVDNNFEPTYTIPDKSQEKIKRILQLAKRAQKIYYATDEDREGEAIAWHLNQILNNIKYQISNIKYRIAFHEITKDAIIKALKNPRQINQNLVDAQQARRILDRLVGYKLSPFLWKKVMRGLSAGRVQSVAVRLIVEREDEINKFKPQEFWTIDGIFNPAQFLASLYKLNNKRLDKFELNNKKQVDKLVQLLKKLNYSVSNIVEKQTKKNPYPPYKTSTMQQDAYSKLRFSSKQTMMIAQQLYEGVKLGSKGSTGLITYMRTDSLNLANKFIVQAKKYLKKHLGEKYSFEQARIFKKAKGAQEAHEAIRPTNINLEPKIIKEHLSPQQYKLYTLIWNRALASLMPAAIIKQKTVEIGSSKAFFRATGSIITFDGFLKIYPIKITENQLPDLKIKQKINLKELKPAQHFTEPPPRYNDGSLVKELEKKGIGRPSTYAPIIGTIQRRNYVTRDDTKRFKPTEIGTLVNQVLVQHFNNIVDYDFTADMENNLDAIAQNKKRWDQVIAKFYQPFAKLLDKKYKEVDKKKLTQEKTKKSCPKCKKHNLIIKIGRFGKFLACPGFPDCRYTEPMPETIAAKKTGINTDASFSKNNNSRENDKSVAPLKPPQCSECKIEMKLKQSRYGKFWACPNYPDCKNTQNIEQKIGMVCPDCKKGDIVIKRTRKGKTFYGCNKYPKCEYASWNKPTT
jgi:DNA topoisomerase-1